MRPAPPIDSMPNICSGPRFRQRIVPVEIIGFEIGEVDFLLNEVRESTGPCYAARVPAVSLDWLPGCCSANSNHCSAICSNRLWLS
jgi:hypothetical protein